MTPFSSRSCRCSFTSSNWLGGICLWHWLTENVMLCVDSVIHCGCTAKLSSRVNTSAYSLKILSSSLFSVAVPGKSSSSTPSSSTPSGSVLFSWCCAALLGVCENASWQCTSIPQDTTHLVAFLGKCQLLPCNHHCWLDHAKAHSGHQADPLTGRIDQMDSETWLGCICQFSRSSESSLKRGSTTVFAPHTKPVTSTFIAECGGIQTARVLAALTSPCLLGLLFCADEALTLPSIFSSSPHSEIFASTFIPRTLGLLLLCWTVAAVFEDQHSALWDRHHLHMHIQLLVSEVWDLESVGTTRHQYLSSTL